MEETKVNKIGQDFTLGKLILFALPAILTTLCTQLFKSIDDGLFVSRYVGPSALSSISILSPINSVIMAFSQLFSVGASTLSAQKMGDGKQHEAKQIFTRTAILGILAGIVLAVLINVFSTPLIRLLGADDSLIENSTKYIRVVHTCAPVTILVAIFSAYYSTAGKPQMGLVCSITNGAVNISLDILFIAVLDMGVIGSSLATILGDIATLLIGTFFFSRKKSEIHFVKPQGDYIPTMKFIWGAGFSQFINSLAFSVTNFVTNRILISYLGSLGIAANSIIADLRIVLNAAFIGYVGCVGPVIAYNYGEKNPKRLKKILGHNLKFWFFGTVGITILGQIFKVQLIHLFFGTEVDPQVFSMTFTGLSIELCASAFTCGCIFVMRMFVALGNPKTASILTTCRTLIIRIACVIALPLIFGEIGVWLSFPVAELISFTLAATLVYLNRNNYGYGKTGEALKMM